MMQTFLEFEKPVQNIVEQIEKLKEVANEGEVDLAGLLVVEDDVDAERLGQEERHARRDVELEQRPQERQKQDEFAGEAGV